MRVLEPGNEYAGIARGIDELGQLLVEEEWKHGEGLRRRSICAWYLQLCIIEIEVNEDIK
ncbi:MAG: hypothetical protein V8T31_01330 [Lachnospiraceae bacterium]